MPLMAAAANQLCGASLFSTSSSWPCLCQLSDMPLEERWDGGGPDQGSCETVSRTDCGMLRPHLTSEVGQAQECSGFAEADCQLDVEK